MQSLTLAGQELYPLESHQNPSLGGPPIWQTLGIAFKKAHFAIEIDM